MKKFFSFSGTISGKIFFLRSLFVVVLTVPGLIAAIAKWTAYFTSLGGFDISDPSAENQMEIQRFGDELSLKIAENPEFYLNDFFSSFSFFWVLIFILCIVPPIWFGLSTYYKRISALFYEQRKGVFLAFLLFDIVSDYIVFNLPGTISTITSFIGILIYAYLIFYSSKFDTHEG